jgi:predicted LPLAT superfamily acyltransferase
VGWTRVGEKGSRLGIWFVVWFCRLFGRAFTRLLLRPVVLYFVALAPVARRASRDYLQRMGQPHRFRDVYAHCLRFAHATLDRMFFVLGRADLFRVTRTGSHHLTELMRQRRGALLFGAHVGSFEAMLGVAEHNAVPLNIVGYFKNARLLNDVLQKLNPNAHARLIAVEPGIDFVLKLKERIDAGELVALLADRVGLGERAVEVDLLGGRVSLPVGPYLLASILRCPIYLTFGLFHEPNRYDLYCEPFAERVELPRTDRERAARDYVERYARRLEHFCRLAPDNWFNFYDYWRLKA